MQFPFVNRITPIQETGGADSYRVPDRRRVLKLGATSLVMPFLLDRLLRAQKSTQPCAPPIPVDRSPSATSLPSQRRSQLLSPQQSNNLARLSQYLSPISVAAGTQFVPGLCLRANHAQTEGISMQNGSMIRAGRRRGPDVWEFRWREPGADGKRKHRRIVLGSIEQLADEAAARQAISALHLEFNRGGAWLKTRSTTVSDLVSHCRERELDPDTVWKTHSTKVTYEGYLNKWILPR